MNSPDQEWWVAQSGEYVLGTLSHPEWITFQKAALHDLQAQQHIAYWERTFQPMADALPPVTPRAHVWEAIEDRVANASQGAWSPDGTVPFDEGFTANTDNALALLHEQMFLANKRKKQARRWRRFAVLATIAGLALAGLAFYSYNELKNAPPPIAMERFNTITVIRNERSMPLWIVDAALKDGLVRVTAVAPPSKSETEDFQLWMVKPDSGGVQSIGIIPQTTHQSAVLKPENIESEAVSFTVSLEPTGGSALDTPSGPVLYQGVVQNLDF